MNQWKHTKNVCVVKKLTKSQRYILKVTNNIMTTYTITPPKFVFVVLRKVIPACAVKEICVNFPSEDGKYMPFTESIED